MKSLGLAVLSFVFISHTAFAASSMSCGEKVDPETLEISGFELEMASVDDDYRGPVGGTWHLKLKHPNAPWIAKNKSIQAKTFDKNGVSIIEVVLKTADAASGPVGERYELVGFGEDFPTLKKYTMGGFAGTVLLNTFQCVSNLD